MLIPERQQAILDFLKEHHAASVNQLSRMLFVSETSIRRDLTRLEKAGLVQKTYGGAILVQGENEVLALNARLEANKEAKILIARKAAAMVTNGSVVFLDSSSTALCMVPFLGKLQSLSVITNGARLAVAFAEYPHVRVYCSGGLLAAHIYSFNGAIAQQALRSMQADMAFVSVKALDPQTGAFCVSEEEAQIRRIMLDNSRRRVLLCSAKKLGNVSTFRLCGLDEIECVATDKAPEGSMREAFAAKGIRVL